MYRKQFVDSLFCKIKPPEFIGRQVDCIENSSNFVGLIRAHLFRQFIEKDLHVP